MIKKCLHNMDHQKNYIKQKPKICGSILGSLFSKIKSLSSNINSIPFTDKWLDKKTEPNIGTVFITLYQLHIKQLVSVITSCIVCIQCNTTERN